MVKFYFRGKGSAYRLVKEKLNLLNVEYEEIPFCPYSPEHNEKIIMELVEKSENGFDDIVIRGKTTREILENYTTKSLVKYLASHLHYLQKCFVVSDKVMVVGVNELDEYTPFIAFEKREMSKFYVS
ncbi:MAG: hypothetical protein RBT45_08535 [Acholeplasmataceae bacterium]|jgi:arsenate reductase-like glutaredoxin family protein|nr:hypothetical protein [Acholeplasmataceae bacterium]